MEFRAENILKGFRKLKVFRVVFLVLASLIAIIGIVVGLKQAVDDGNPGPAAFGLIFAVFTLFVAGGVWYFIDYFMKSATESMVKLNGAQFEQELTGEVNYWKDAEQFAEKNPNSVPNWGDLSIQATANVNVNGVEVTLQLSSANLFTKEDLRGNIDIVVAAEPSNEILTLVQTLCDHLTLRLPVRQKTLPCLSHGNHDPEDASFATVLGYSFFDLVEEFEFNPDREQLDAWLDEFAAASPMIEVLWDDHMIAEVPCHVVD